MKMFFQNYLVISLQVFYSLLLNIYFTQYYFGELHRRILQNSRNKYKNVAIRSAMYLLIILLFIKSKSSTPKDDASLANETIATSSRGILFLSFSFALIISSWCSKTTFPNISQFIWLNGVISLKNFIFLQYPHFFNNIIDLIINILSIYIFIILILYKTVIKQTITEGAAEDLRYNGRNYLPRIYDIDPDAEASSIRVETSHEGDLSLESSHEINRVVDGNITDEHETSVSTNQLSIVDIYESRIRNLDHENNTRFPSGHNALNPEGTLEILQTSARSVFLDEKFGYFFPIMQNYNPFLYLFEVLFDNILLIYAGKPKYHTVKSRSFLSPILLSILAIVYFKIRSIFQINCLIFFGISLGYCTHFCRKSSRFFNLLSFYNVAVSGFFYFIVFHYINKISLDTISHNKSSAILMELFKAIHMSIPIGFLSWGNPRLLFTTNIITLNIINIIMGFADDREYGILSQKNLFFRIETLGAAMMLFLGCYPYILCKINGNCIRKDLALSLGLACIFYFYLFKILSIIGKENK